jgi:surface antigen
VSANKAQVTEGHDATITFSVTPTAHPALTVNYSTVGSATFNTDYTVSGTPGQVAIAANQASASITMHAVTDTIKDGGETAKFVVGAGAGYQVGASPKVGVTIQDP